MPKPHMTNPRSAKAVKQGNVRFYKTVPEPEKTPEQIEAERREQMQAELMAWAEKTNAVAVQLVEANPDLHPITAQIMAGDIISAERATGYVETGELPVEKAVSHVGSFARWDWVLTMMAAGRVSEDWFAANVCDLWRGSDPDDTNVAYLRLWQRLWRKNGGAVIRDGRPLPKGGKDGMLRVYRGGLPKGIATGFAWTTDPKIARKFANGAGSRVQTPGGIVIAGLVKPSHVIAFITRRGESEVIVDPTMVKGVHVTGR